MFWFICKRIVKTTVWLTLIVIFFTYTAHYWWAALPLFGFVMWGWIMYLGWKNDPWMNEAVKEGYRLEAERSRNAWDNRRD